MIIIDALKNSRNARISCQFIGLICLFSWLFRDRCLPRGDHTGEEVQHSTAVQQDVQGRISKTGFVQSFICLEVWYILCKRLLRDRLLCPRPPYRKGHYKMTSGVHLSVCRLPQPNSKERKGLGSPHHTGNSWTYLAVKRSNVKVTGSKSV